MQYSTIQWKIIGVMFLSWDGQHTEIHKSVAFCICVFDSASAVALSTAAGMFASKSEKQCASFQMHLSARIYVKMYLFQLLPGENYALAECNFKWTTLLYHNCFVILLHAINKRAFLITHTANMATCCQKQSFHGMSGVEGDKKPLWLWPSYCYSIGYFSTVRDMMAK